MGAHSLFFPIDSLKFEERRLLNKGEIKDLKEKYKIRENEKVILGGSLDNPELSYLEKPLKNFLKKEKNSKILFVHRYPEWGFEKILN